MFLGSKKLIAIRKNMNSAQLSKFSVLTVNDDIVNCSSLEFIEEEKINTSNGALDVSIMLFKFNISNF